MASLGAALKADLKKQHWDYGYERHGDHMRTTYRDDMVEKKGKQAAMSKEAKDDLRRCHFEYGATPAAESVGGTTTMAAHFQGRAGGPSALSKAAQADLRASHFVPGYEQDMKPFMNTTANQLDGQKGPPAKLSAAVKADLRKSHFDVGLHNYKWESLAKSDFTEEARGEGKTADMPEATMKDLRAVHFSYGFVPTGPSEYTTTSRSQSDAYADPRLNKNRNPYGEAAEFVCHSRERTSQLALPRLTHDVDARMSLHSAAGLRYSTNEQRQSLLSVYAADSNELRGDTIDVLIHVSTKRRVTCLHKGNPLRVNSDQLHC